VPQLEVHRWASLNSTQSQALWAIRCLSCRSMHGRYATRSELWTWAAVIKGCVVEHGTPLARCLSYRTPGLCHWTTIHRLQTAA